MSQTFIKATEFWLPSQDRSQLEYGGGLYGPAAHMARISREMCFGYGEGLPGRAWQTGAPVVLHSFEGSYFRRTEAALADGLTCGIALPIFMGDYLSSVAVFFCGDDEDHAGAIEVWRNQPARSKDMTLADGHYGRTADTFEFTSRRTAFRAGTGLPGLAWQQRAPVFLLDLGRGSGFLRGDSAVKVGPGANGSCRWITSNCSSNNTRMVRRAHAGSGASGATLPLADVGRLLPSGVTKVAGGGPSHGPSTLTSMPLRRNWRARPNTCACTPPGTDKL